MSIVKITEEWDGLALSISTDLMTWSGSGPRKYKVQFDGTEEAAARPVACLNEYLTYTVNIAGSVKIPPMFSVHPYDVTWYVNSKTVKPSESPFLWEVIVNYEYVESPFSFLNNEFSFTFVGSTEPIDRDKFGRKIENSAHEPFEPAITKDFYDLSLRITRNEAAFDPVNGNGRFLGAINSTSWLVAQGGFNSVYSNGSWIWTPTNVTVAARTAKCISMEAQRKRFGNIIYWRVAYEFLIRNRSYAGVNEGWKKRVLDQGFREVVDGTVQNLTDSDGDAYKNVTGGTFREILDDDGKQISEPAPLNGEGVKSAVGAAATFKLYKVEEELDFNLLYMSASDMLQ